LRGTPVGQSSQGKRLSCCMSPCLLTKLVHSAISMCCSTHNQCNAHFSVLFNRVRTMENRSIDNLRYFHFYFGTFLDVFLPDRLIDAVLFYCLFEYRITRSNLAVIKFVRTFFPTNICSPRPGNCQKWGNTKNSGSFLPRFFAFPASIQRYTRKPWCQALTMASGNA
jgi:hypothetical protein